MTSTSQASSDPSGGEATNGSKDTPSYSQMSINPSRAKTLTDNLNSVTSLIAQTISKTSSPKRPVRLIAVSKLKPANDIQHLHAPPHNHIYFGENYAQELQQKAELLPRSIRWCFIGALQTNKCKSLARDVSNLWCVSSVDSEKKANELDKGRGIARETDTEVGTLRVHVQVNTSGEAEKSGVEPSDAAAICQHIREKCENLRVVGLMTIGAIARSQATTEETENEDFVRLREVRDQVCRELRLRQEELELSMGMSADYESAIRQGSDEVRVGSTIFGERPARGDAKVKEDVEEGGK